MEAGTRRRLTVMLPCFNEEQALPGLLERLEELRGSLSGWELDVLVVDDGSADATAEVAGRGYGELPVRVHRHAENSGLGAALRTGIELFVAATGDGPDAVLAVMDADGTHPPELLPAMLARLDEGCDVVIASRYAPGGGEHGLPPLRLLYSRVASTVLRLAARVPGALDYSCGYRVYRRSILQRGLTRHGEQLVTETSFVCMAELLIKLGRLGARIGEVGLELHYELKQGASKMRVAATIRRYVALTTRVVFGRLE